MLNFKMFSFSLLVMMTLARSFNFNAKRYLQSQRWVNQEQAIVEKVEKTSQRDCRNMRRGFRDAGAISKVGAQKILITFCLPKRKLLIFEK